MLEGHPVNWIGGMHALTCLVDGEGDVRLRECEILERPDDAAVGCQINRCTRLGDR